MKEFSQKYLDLLTGPYKDINLTRITEFEEFHDKQIVDSILPRELFPEFEGGDQLCVNTGVSWDWNKLKAKTVELGDDLRGKLDLEISDLDWTGSRFFKRVYKNPHRLGAMVREGQVDDTIEN